MARIRELTEADWPAVEAVYAEGISTGHATFETATPTWDVFEREHLAGHMLVAVSGGDGGGVEGVADGAEVVGWAALAPTSTRPCYAGVVECSVYVAARARGTGVGRGLMETLVARAAAAGLWTIQTSIFPENEASVALHERVGFRVVGRRERIAQLHGAWRDTLLLELRL